MSRGTRRWARSLIVLAALTAAALAAAAPGGAAPKPKFTTAAAFDVSPPVTLLVPSSGEAVAPPGNTRSGNAPVAAGDAGFAGDAAIQTAGFGAIAAAGPLANFEGA